MSSRKRGRGNGVAFATYKDVPVDVAGLFSPPGPGAPDHTYRIPFRVRPGDETESVVVGAGSKWDVAQVRMNSANSSTPAMVHFVNNSGRDVRLLWIDYHGNEVKYLRVRPGRVVPQGTFETHPWIARDINTGERLCIGGNMVYFPQACRPHAVANITIPPRTGWEPELHWAFPHELQEATRQLLLAAHISPCQATGMSTIASRLSARPRTRRNIRSLEAAQLRNQEVAPAPPAEAAPAPCDDAAVETRASKRRRRGRSTVQEQGEQGGDGELSHRGAGEPVGSDGAPSSSSGSNNDGGEEGQPGLGDLPPGVLMNIVRAVMGGETIIDVRPPPLPPNLLIKRAPNSGVYFLANIPAVHRAMHGEFEEYFAEL